MRKLYRFILITIILASCVNAPYPELSQKINLPDNYGKNISSDTLSMGTFKWKLFLNDSDLISIIDTALKNNLELKIFLQEINIAKNNIRIKKADYLPFLNIVGSSSFEKNGKYTIKKSVEENLLLPDNNHFSQPLPDLLLGTSFSWEIDVWKKLRNLRKAAIYKYYSTLEGKNLLVSRLVTEISELYYELMALDNQLEITQKNIEIINNALGMIKQEKDAARTTELAVKRFEAELYKNISLTHYIKQKIKIIENKLCYLTGKYPFNIKRSLDLLNNPSSFKIKTGIPSGLLNNRPDIRKARMELIAALFEKKSAKAELLPSIKLTGMAGINSNHTSYFFKLPESILLSIAGDLITPLVNRNAIKANYFNSIANKNKCVIEYEQKVLNAYFEVNNELNNLENLTNNFNAKFNQTEALKNSIDISLNLFKNARADYMEVLLTQRDYLEFVYELIEIRKQLFISYINLYRALGGGWN
ncbi:MAG: TolC family protein [Bacteroidia bacterium]|nr:TolC family protein [Bacteroidia bacterium]